MDNEKFAKGLVKIAKSILASEKKADAGESIIKFGVHEFFTIKGRLFDVAEWDTLSDAIQDAAYDDRKAMVALVMKTLKRDKAVVDLIKNTPDAGWK